MNYRDKDFTVVQSLSPKGWKWSVNLGHKEASGTQYCTSSNSVDTCSRLGEPRGV
jgi:hypothetical protein